MSPEPADACGVVPDGLGTAQRTSSQPRLRLVPHPPLRVVDVALFYAERGGGIRTYLDAKRAWAQETGAYEHHLVIPGARERHDGTRHTLRAPVVNPKNGYRMTPSTSALQRTLRAIRPDIVLLHDPFWATRATTQTAQELGARVVVVNHGSVELEARAIPGPARVYAPLLRAWTRHACAPADAVMSVVDAREDCGRVAAIPLRLGLHPAFRPEAHTRRGDHVLYVGRLARQKGVFELLEAAARAREPWPLLFIGSGPAESAIRVHARRLGIADRVSVRPYVSDRRRLARIYARARCVVMPGEHETFGLVALEAAASGARVVACDNAPSASACGTLAHRYVPGDVDGLEQAIDAARSAPTDLAAAGALAWRYAWPRVLDAEATSLHRLAAR